MGALALRDSPMWLRFNRMDEIWEFMGILNKEDGSIVSHQVENALFSVKLGRKSPLTSDSDVWIKRSNRKQPGVRGNKREETLSGKA